MALRAGFLKRARRARKKAARRSFLFLKLVLQPSLFIIHRFDEFCVHPIVYIAGQQWKGMPICVCYLTRRRIVDQRPRDAIARWTKHGRCLLLMRGSFVFLFLMIMLIPTMLFFSFFFLALFYKGIVAVDNVASDLARLTVQASADAPPNYGLSQTTTMLKDALGGNCRTAAIITLFSTVTPATRRVLALADNLSHVCFFLFGFFSSVIFVIFVSNFWLGCLFTLPGRCYRLFLC